jgi:hypothetical protein
LRRRFRSGGLSDEFPNLFISDRNGASDKAVGLHEHSGRSVADVVRLNDLPIRLQQNALNSVLGELCTVFLRSASREDDDIQ